ncbi:MAG: hypothetical protein WC993_10080, partial [Methanoculleus sp.]
CPGDLPALLLGGLVIDPGKTALPATLKDDERVTDPAQFSFPHRSVAQTLIISHGDADTISVYPGARRGSIMPRPSLS